MSYQSINGGSAVHLTTGNTDHWKGTQTHSSGKQGRFSRRTYIVAGSVLAGVVILAAVLGGVLGTQLNKNSNSSNNGKSNSGIAAVDAAAASPLTTTLQNGQTTVINPVATSTANAAAASASASPLTKWDFKKMSYAGAIAAASAGNKNYQGPMVGVALGNWMVLEQWMDEAWFNSSAKNNASVRDEWTLMQVLGANAKDVMNEHWATWVTEDDIEILYQHGINNIRVPLGYWAFVPAYPGEPYLFQAGQLDYVTALLGWLYKRRMYATIDLHGLPGSQNGEMTSGHLTTNPTFFSTTGQNRSDATVDAVLSWITASPYRSVISALDVCNEPRPYTSGQIDMLKSFYQRSYDKASKLSNPVPIIFHHGYVQSILNTPPITYWRSFVADKDPSLIAYSDHPYPGTFPLQSDQQDMLKQVCNSASSYNQFPVPVLITEWSIRTGVTDESFERAFYAQQATAWANTGGGHFWSMRVNNGSTINLQYSFLDLVKKGSIPLPSANQSEIAFLQSLGTGCGAPSTQPWASSATTKRELPLR